MTKYQRYVYYIYNYEMGEKRANIGFLRVEVRNGTCKMTIQIRALSQGSPLKILLFKRGEEHLRCCEIGQLSMVNGMGSTSLSYTLQELSDMYYALEDIAGMILFADKDKFYATTWDDEGIEIDKMVIEETGNREKEEITHEKEAENHEKETGNHEKEVETHEKEAEKDEKGTEHDKKITEAHKMTEAIPQPSPNLASATETDTVSVPSPVKQDTKSDAPVSNTDAQAAIPDTNAGTMSKSPASFVGQVQSVSMPSSVTQAPPASAASQVSPDPAASVQQSSDTTPDTSGDPVKADLEAMGFDENNFVEISPSCAAKILNSYPKMYPFESDNVLDCVRIELQDLHELPIEYWAMAHNSFLLQGYYSYLHLLFAQIQNENKEKSYVIGIPGICHVKQNYLAGRFGFRHFLPLRQTDDINGEFGYWLLEVSKRSV